MDEEQGMDGDPCLTGWVGVHCNLGLNTVEKLVLEANDLDGTLPDLSPLSSLFSLLLDKNKLSGSIPDFWGSFSTLRSIFLNDNQFSGTFPNSMKDVNRTLLNLNLADNQLEGTIPDIFRPFNQLQFVDLGANKFNGTIPESFGEMAKLGSLYLDYNQLTGTLIDFTGDEILWEIVMNDNSLSGTIPKSICQMNLQFDLTHNDFSCPHPNCCETCCGQLCEREFRLKTKLRRLNFRFFPNKKKGPAEDWYPLRDP